MIVFDTAGTSLMLLVIYFYAYIQSTLRALSLIVLAIIHRGLSWIHLDLMKDGHTGPLMLDQVTIKGLL